MGGFREDVARQASLGSVTSIASCSIGRVGGGVAGRAGSTCFGVVELS